MVDLDISGWAPKWLPARDQIDAQRSNLLSLRDHRIIDSWLVWNLERDEWFADLPVVLLFDDGRQLEVSWQKFDDLSTTWNTIDVSTAPTAWVTWPLAWRSQGHSTLRNIVGRPITAVASTEHKFTIRQVRSSPVENQTRCTWLVGGIWLQTSDSGLHIFNALDENGLANDTVQVTGEHRAHPL